MYNVETAFRIQFVCYLGAQWCTSQINWGKWKCNLRPYNANQLKR